MNKSILLIVIIASLLTVGLYSLPKVVVRNDNKQLAGSTTHATPTDSMRAGSDVANPAISHEKPITSVQRKQLTDLQTAFATTAPAGRETAGTKIIAFFREITRYDSAAYYGSLLATANPSESNLLRAGDLAFEAYTFAVDEKKITKLGQQTRDFYQRALAKNPNLLAAKANMAMTYVNTDTPMQGIMLLRQVLAQDPTNELALFNLGMLSMRSNQYDRAIERFRQILVNNPTSRKAQFYLGISLAEAGQKVEARQVLAQVKQRESDPQILAAIREYEDRLK